MTTKAEKLASMSFDDVMNDPTSVGLPSFDEFRKNPEILLGRADDRLTEVDKGSINLNRIAKKYTYEIEGFKCKTLQEVERTALRMGINLRELDYKPVIQPNTSGSYDIKVTFVSKSVRDQRKKWA